MIKVMGLSKEFDHIKAVSDVSFSIQRGEVLGLLGPNGAGKSTTMRMLTGFIPPTSGDATIDGLSIGKEQLQIRKKIGYVPENAPLYGDMTVREFLSFMADLREIPKAEKTSAIDNVLETCSLKSVEFQTIETLSKGFKRRVSVAQALIHDPDFLMLDEPTDGLDPNQKFDVRKLINKLSETKCIIISTHILEEVESVCNRALIIAQGKKLFDGTPQELKEKSATGRVDDVFRAITTGRPVEGVTL